MDETNKPYHAKFGAHTPQRQCCVFGGVDAGGRNNQTLKTNAMVSDVQHGNLGCGVVLIVGVFRL